MNHTNRRRIETAACERRYGIADAKGAEYSGAGATYQEDGADTLRNFKAVAERIGGSPEQVLLTYMLKHMDSITTTVREAAVYNAVKEPGLSAALDNKRRAYAKGEGIVSRLDDLRNYADLCECLLIDLGLIYDPDDTACVGFDRVQFSFGEVDADPGEIKHPNPLLDSMPSPYNPTRTSVGEDDPSILDDWPNKNVGDCGMCDDSSVKCEDCPSVGNGDNMVNEGGYVNPMEDIPPQVTPEEFEDITGMTKCFDGVWRQKPDVDPSVPPGTPPQTPMFRLEEETGHIRAANDR